jgi:uncharacterized protein YecE (DUF72 family)
MYHSTFYRTPSESTVRGWYAKTPPGFVFAAKFPQAITHEKMLVDCDAEVRKFLAAMGLLGEKRRKRLPGVTLWQIAQDKRPALRKLDAAAGDVVRAL